MFAKAVNPLFTRVLGFFSFCVAFYVVPENLLVIGCCYALAFKVKKKVHIPEEEWQIIPSTQEAIIDEDTFERV